jgi:hypothetical protein
MPDHHVNDDDVLGALRDGLSKLPVTQPPPLEAIVARGRARRRRSGLAGMGLAAAGLAIALPVILTSVNRPGGRVAPSVRLGSGPVHVNLAAFSVDSNPNGTVSVKLARGQSFDPRELRQILAKAGVAAVVNYGAFCATPVQPAGFEQVVLNAAPGNRYSKPGTGSSPRSLTPGEVTAMVIRPAAMPKRAELSIGYFPDHVAVTLVRVGGPLSCMAADPPACNIPSAGQARAATPPSPSGVTTAPAASTTLPSASTSVPSSSVTYTTGTSAATVVPGSGAAQAATTMPAASTTLPPSATTSLPPAATANPPGATRTFQCQVPAPGSTGVTGTTAGATTTTTVSSAST